MNEAALIAIITDFGSMDPFTGIMKGVIYDIAPQSTVIDLTNDIPPGDVKRAAINLWQSCRYFPPGTVFLCVVDPGVGTSRKAILMQSGQYTFIGPDNGLFTFVMGEDAQIWALSNPEYMLPAPGTTFHGRDIFAPAAAHAALGVRGPKFGPAMLDPVTLPSPQLASIEPGVLQGEILYADRFGNWLTSFGRFEKLADGNLLFKPWLEPLRIKEFQEKLRPDGLVVELEDGTSLDWAGTFADIPAGKCGFLLGSSGLIEIVSDRRSAKEILDLNSGDPIKLKIKGEPHGSIYH